MNINAFMGAVITMSIIAAQVIVGLLRFLGEILRGIVESEVIQGIFGVIHDVLHWLITLIMSPFVWLWEKGVRPFLEVVWSMLIRPHRSLPFLVYYLPRMVVAAKSCRADMDELNRPLGEYMTAMTAIKRLYRGMVEGVGMDVLVRAMETAGEDARTVAYASSAGTGLIPFYNTLRITDFYIHELDRLLSDFDGTMKITYVRQKEEVGETDFFAARGTLTRYEVITQILNLASDVRELVGGGMFWWFSVGDSKRGPVKAIRRHLAKVDEIAKDALKS